MTVDELPEHLNTHWPALREQLLAGTYQPSPVRWHAIPKSGGEVRELGSPTVVDRFIQQAILRCSGLASTRPSRRTTRSCKRSGT